MTGTLYGIGVGPGDPDLITLKAVRVLEKVDVIYGASSTKNDYSLAMSIAREYLKKDVHTEFLKFPMTRQADTLEQAWEDNTDRVAETLKKGQNAAFLTLGDPLIYSTFGYLLQTMKKKYSELACEIIPGITSFQAAAALTGTILTESGENLWVMSGVDDQARLQELIDRADNAVILKTYRDYDRICQTLRQLDLDRHAVLISQCGQEGQRIEYDLNALRGEKLPYLSLIIMKKKGLISGNGSKPHKSPTPDGK